MIHFRQNNRPLVCLFKVAMGSRRGPSIHGTIDLFIEISKFESISALKLAYPGVKPITLEF
jgi:hypothetical protein